MCNRKSQSISQIGQGPIHIPNLKYPGPYAQLERGRSISLTGKGPTNIENGKGANPYRH